MMSTPSSKSSSTSTAARKVIDAQAREIINNVSLYFEKEKTYGQPLLPVQNSIGRAAAATGVSARTIHRIKRQIKTSENGKVQGPCKKRHRPAVFQFNVSDVELIRRTIADMYLQSKEAAPLHRIVDKFKAVMEFDGSLQTMRKALSSIGFKSKKIKNNKSIFVEGEEMVCQRRDYLGKIRAYRGEMAKVVYIDETYIFTTRIVPKCWQSNNLEKCSGEDDLKRLYIIHAASDDGFVPNGLCMFKSGQTTGEYRGEMYYQNFEKYFKEQLLPNLYPGTVIVLDNASYHNVLVNEWPTMSWTRQKIVEWLKFRKIEFNMTMLKAELLRLSKGHPPDMKYKIDELAATHGHVVLRLPPCHPELNPLETAWLNMKCSMYNRNVDIHSKELQDLVTHWFASVKLEEWISICNRVKQLEHDYWERDIKLDSALEKIISSEKEKGTNNVGVDASVAVPECDECESEEDMQWTTVITAPDYSKVEYAKADMTHCNTLQFTDKF